MTEKRKISVRKILQVLLTLVVTCCCIIAIISAAKIDDNKTLNNIVINIKNNKKYQFIEQKEILDKAITNRQIDIMNIPVGKIDIHEMENVLKTDPWVADAQIYIDKNKILNIYVTQRIPVTRIFGKDNTSYYMDNTMHFMPLTDNFIFYTTVVTNVPEIKNDSTGNVLKSQILYMVNTIQADTFWNIQITQIIVDSNNKFELIPVLGNQKIIFGDTARAKDKFDNLFIFYKNVLNRIGWDKYETLDLRFKGQVVASPTIPYHGPVDKFEESLSQIKARIEADTKNEDSDSLVDVSGKDTVATKPKDKKQDIKKEDKSKKKDNKKKEEHKKAKNK